MSSGKNSRALFPDEVAADKPLLADTENLLSLALAEDVGSGDVTSRICVPAEAETEAHLTAREDGVLAGLWIVQMVYDLLEDGVVVARRAEEGATIRGGACVGTVSGPVAGILTGERVALNCLQRLSGVATLTRRFVNAVEGTRSAICDTRKTTPGWRRLEKYAVRCGGADNHRMGLYDAVLIKDNHVAASNRSIEELATEARRRVEGRMEIEIEVDGLDQLEAVLPLGMETVLLDNMKPAQLREAVALRDRLRPGGPPKLEASGGVTLERVREIAETGVDRISVGALTHSAPALDVAMDIRRT